MAFQQQLSFRTSGRGLIDISKDIQAVVSQSGADIGLCNVFVPHTSASLILNENWDPDVQTDLEAFFARLVPDGDPLFIHTSEGPDDMPAHVRTALTQSSVSIPITGGQLATGTWQGLYLWEHRTAPHQRKITVTVVT
ncbi:MAG: secondary thiamine-phosphate synthase enzyme YjbQ [Gammaproteobacteria bacterium]|nr:secondary thiamine-phosphate synthase enzyme YjbQ [Gammaproteobacteria bacterium]